MSETILLITLKSVLAPLLTEFVKTALSSNPRHPAENIPFIKNSGLIKKQVEEAKGILDKGNGLDFEKLKNLVDKLTEAEIYRDTINYIFKHKLEGNIKWDHIENQVEELLKTLKELIKELSAQPSKTKKNKNRKNQSSGHQIEGEMPPGNVRRCLLYLSHFLEGYVFNHNRISRLSVAHEFIAADSSEPPLQQLTNWLEVAESNWNGNGAPYHFLIGNKVGEQAPTWPESHHFVREALTESIESIGAEIIFSSLIFLGQRNNILKIGGQFFLLKILSLRNARLDNEKNLKKLSFLKYLDLKHTTVRDCSWLEGLEELQMLDLRDTGVEEIPDKCLEKLRKLQHLLLGYRPKDGDNRLVGAKLNTKKLMTTELKTLRSIRQPQVIDQKVSTVADLFVTNLETKHLKTFWDILENYENLTSLGVAMNNDSVITLQDCRDKLKNKLERLQMEGQFSQPHSGLAKLCQFKKLIDLTLVSHKKIEIVSIPQIKTLCCLRLYGFRDETTLTFGVLQFENLKKLVIGDMKRVKTVELATAVIEAVATLKLCNLPQFRELVCLDPQSQQIPLLSFSESPTGVLFKKFESQKTIFLRGIRNGRVEKSPRLKLYRYDTNKQCYKEVN